MTVQPPRNILFPTDNSEHCAYAFQYYLKYLMKDRDQVIMFHCVDANKSVPMMLPTLLLDMAPPETADDVMANKMKALITDNKLRGKVIIVKEADAGQAIVKAVAQYKIDTIVMGTQGETLNERKTVGRVCAHVMQNTFIPTLLCRLPQTSERKK